MKTLTILLALSLFALTGCAQQYGDHYNVVIDPSLGPVNIQATLDAVDSWVAVTDGALSFEVSLATPGECNGSLEAHRVCVYAETTAEFKALESQQGVSGDYALTFREHYDGANVWIPTTIDSGYDVGQMTTIIAHELGHAMGLGHTTDAHSGVMYPGWSHVAPLPTCSDLAQLMSLRGQSDIDDSCPQGGSYQLNGDGTN
jgi:hypothetical protein